MKILTHSFYVLIIIFLSSEVHCQTVTTPNGNPNPTTSQTMSAYKFIKDSGTQFDLGICNKPREL